jgi:hypothetical protein
LSLLTRRIKKMPSTFKSSWELAVSAIALWCEREKNNRARRNQKPRRTNDSTKILNRFTNLTKLNWLLPIHSNMVSSVERATWSLFRCKVNRSFMKK